MKKQLHSDLKSENVSIIIAQVLSFDRKCVIRNEMFLKDREATLFLKCLYQCSKKDTEFFFKNIFKNVDKSQVSKCNGRTKGETNLPLQIQNPRFSHLEMKIETEPRIKLHHIY